MSQRPKKPVRRFDSFINSITGLGDSSRDKREGGTPLVHDELTQQNFEDLYRGSDLGGTLVEALPDEMTREGFRVSIENEPDLEEDVNAFIAGLDFYPRLKEALYWSRQHGGAGILVGADDGTPDLSLPLDMDRIKTIRFFTSLTRWELYPLYYYGDPVAPKYGFVSVFFLQQLFGLPQELIDPSGQNGGAAFVPQSNSVMQQMQNYPEISFKATTKGYEGRALENEKRGSLVATGVPLRTVHESRFLLFDGVPVNRVQRIRNNGWGDSVFTRVFEVLRDYEMSWAGVCNLLADFAQGVYNIQGLNELMNSGDDGAVAGRAAMIDMSRSIARAILLDAGSPDQPAEKFERQVASLSGLPETLDKLSLRLAAAARMPQSLLMGQAPSGLNASGDADVRWYYDKIRAAQNEHLTPALRRLMKIIFATKDGPTKGKEPENWDIVYNSLWQLGSDEEADRRFKIAQADQIYISAQVVTPQEVAISRFGSDEYNGDVISIDKESRDAFGATVPEEVKGLAVGIQSDQGNNPDGSPKPTPNDIMESKQESPGEPAQGMAAKSEEDKAAADTSPEDEKPGNQGKAPSVKV